MRPGDAEIAVTAVSPEQHEPGAVGAEWPDDVVDTVLRLLPDAGVVVDDAGRIVAANPDAETMFGYPAGGLLGMSVDTLVPDRLRPGHTRHRASYAVRPTRRPMGAARELWAVRQNGSEFPVDISLAPLGNAEHPLTLAAVRDLSERRTEWEAQARLAAIVSSSDDAIVSMDMNGTLTSWNPGAERLLGYAPEDIVGRPVWRLVPEALRGEVEEQMARVRGGVHVPTRDTLRLHRSGREVEVAESLSLVHDPGGNPTGMSALMRDITERKRADRELRRLLVDGQRRERWLSAISEVRLSMLGGGDLEEWLALMARRTLELADADGVVVIVPSPRDETMFEVAAVHGAPVEALRHQLFPIADSTAGRVFGSGRTFVADEPSAVGVRVLDFEAVAQRVGPILLVPLTTAHGPGGVLSAVRLAGSPAFSPEEIRVVESFGQQAGLAVELDRAQADRQQLALIGDRERIARDLHDHVIQRLFAVGMSLQAATHSIADPAALDRINESVEELDATIRDVRSTIFSLALRSTDRADTSARARILEVAASASTSLGFQPRLQFDGPVDARVPGELLPDVLAVLREALSNTARHAHATKVEVLIDVHEDLSLTVTDDGRGIGDTNRSSGLGNMRARAEARGGSMTVSSPQAGGTRLVWRVPLRS